jgi:hypothetical protein
MTAPRPIGFWLKLVDRLIDQRFEMVLEEHGVTRRQWQLLNVLKRGPAPLEQLDTGVAPFLDDEGESSAEHLEELVGSGWVAPGYSLTEAGVTAMDGLGHAVEELRNGMSEGIADEDYATTLAVLERMARNLGWSEDAGPTSDHGG